MNAGADKFQVFASLQTNNIPDLPPRKFTIQRNGANNNPKCFGPFKKHLYSLFSMRSPWK